MIGRRRDDHQARASQTSAAAVARIAKARAAGVAPSRIEKKELKSTYFTRRMDTSCPVARVLKTRRVPIHGRRAPVRVAARAEVTQPAMSPERIRQQAPMRNMIAGTAMSDGL